MLKHNVLSIKTPKRVFFYAFTVFRKKLIDNEFKFE